jgi:hypothetical protein
MICFFRTSCLSLPYALLCVLLAALCLVGCNKEEKAVAASAARLKDLVRVGMDVDAAIVAIREEGFTVGKKIKPTKKADYYQVNVVLRDRIPASETAKYVLDVPSKKRSYVVIKALLDGKIISIE